ncbi:MAG: ATP-binding cassette domain-containing protein [Chloroflexota bacterium]
MTYTNKTDTPGSLFYFLKQGILVYLRPYVSYHVHLFCTVAYIVAFETALPLLLRFLIDDVLSNQDETASLLWKTLFLMVGLYIILIIVRVWQAYIRAQLGSALKRTLRIMLFDHVQRLPSDYFDKVEPGMIAGLFAHELMDVLESLRDLFIRGLAAFLTSAVLLTTLFLLNWPFALTITILIPLTIYFSQGALQRATVASSEETSEDLAIVSAVQDQVNVQEITRAFGLGETSLNHFTEKVLRYDPNTKKSRWQNFREGLRKPPFLLSMVSVTSENQQSLVNAFSIGMGAYLVFIGQLTIGDFSAFILIIPKLGSVIDTFWRYLQDSINAASGLEAMERMMAQAAPSESETHLTELPRPERGQEIRFKDVTFGYTEDIRILNKLNLTIPIGRSLAIVGRSGSGKSTLLRLLLRFYEPSGGVIDFDGIKLSEFSHKSLREKIGTVFQHTPLLHASIRDNLLLANDDATIEDIIHATQAAGIHPYITSLPDGYDTMIGDDGDVFSEGQLQRIAIARAILRKPRILLLDEVTASLDPEAEASINQTIQQLTKTSTVILVTHRLSSAAFADQIVVMDEGTIVESGTHESLVAKEGLYRSFWQMQTGFIISADGLHAQVRSERLQTIPLFRQLDLDTLEQLATEFVSKYYPANETLFEQGDVGDSFYIIVRGRVAVSASGASDRTIELAELQDGDYFGEGALLHGNKRSATIVTKRPTLVLTLPADRFHYIVDEVTSLRGVVMQMALGRNLSIVHSLGRRKRTHPIWERLIDMPVEETQDKDDGQMPHMHQNGHQGNGHHPNGHHPNGHHPNGHHHVNHQTQSIILPSESNTDAHLSGVSALSEEGRAKVLA